MTVFTRTWDETIPPNTQAASQGANRIRDHKVDVKERLEVDHSMAADADDGAHKKVTLVEQASAPTNATDRGFVYAKDVAGVTELFYEDDTGAEIQITVGGKVNGAALATASVTADHLAANSVGNSEMANDAIDTAELVDGAATGQEISFFGNQVTSSISINSGADWDLPQGLYILYPVGPSLLVEFSMNSGWRDQQVINVTTVWSDGTSCRVRNTTGGALTLYYRRFGFV